LHGRRALRARALNLASVGASAFMNAIAAEPGWHNLAIWALPPVAYALASDTLIGVVRARHQHLAGEAATPLAILGPGGGPGHRAMTALKKIAGPRTFLLAGDSKLISWANATAMAAGQVAFVAPLARSSWNSTGASPALITVICLALLIFCLAGRQVRQALAPHAEMMTGLPGCPTGRTIFRALADLRLIPAHDGNPPPSPNPPASKPGSSTSSASTSADPRWSTP